MGTAVLVNRAVMPKTAYLPVLSEAFPTLPHRRLRRERDTANRALPRSGLLLAPGKHREYFPFRSFGQFRGYLYRRDRQFCRDCFRTTGKGRHSCAVSRHCHFLGHSVVFLHFFRALSVLMQGFGLQSPTYPAAIGILPCPVGAIPYWQRISPKW